MKVYLTIITSCFLAAAAIATPIIDFKNWSDLIEKSPDIFIAVRANTNTYPTPVKIGANQIVAFTRTDGGVPNPIGVCSVLKGDAKTGPAELWLSDYDFMGRGPRQGELFLVFAGSHGDGLTNSSYKAPEDYRTVVIGPLSDFNTLTNALAGKPLNEQVDIILKTRIDTLNAQMTEIKAEKKRLEDGLKELEK